MGFHDWHIHDRALLARNWDAHTQVLVKVSDLVVGSIILLSLVLIHNLHQLTLIDGRSWDICLLQSSRRSLLIIFPPAIEVNIDGQFSRVCAGLVGRGARLLLGGSQADASHSVHLI